MLVSQEEQECRICKANFTDKGTPVNELQVIFGQPITHSPWTIGQPTNCKK